ncbi:MAG TPA: acyl-CoA dehydrogenase [Kineosporiaceae bacterium]|nr:acyl-CoA dehydrogenase [Kineosporiaceae bacterium]
MSIATTDEQAALQRSIRQYAAGTDTKDIIRRCEPHLEPGRSRPGPELAALWRGVADVGVLGIAMPEEFGGAGGSVADVAVALEEAALGLLPGPLLPTVLAGLLLARQAGPAAAKRLIPRLSDGSLTAGVALGPGELTARRLPDGGIRVSGTVRAVLGASPEAQLVLAARSGGTEDVWFTIDPGWPGVEIEECAPLDFSRPLAGLRFADVEVPTDQLLIGLTSASVTELAAVLAGAEAVGVAAWCLQTACDHARIREQFGRPIGSFQAVKHLCAQMLCRLEKASAVTWDAARAAAAGEQLPLAAAVSAATALDAAVENAKACIQVLGGIGFTWEHDAHLYLRRALAQRQWLGGSGVWRRRVAELALAGARRQLELDPGLHPHDDAQRQRVRADLAEISTLPAAQRRPRLAETGYLAPHWPQPYGQGAGAGRQLLIDEELRRAGLERPDLVVGGWALPTIIQHGTPEQQDRFVLPTLRGELTWCQLFSEPEAGSDLASLRTRAQRVPGGWQLTGQKIWTSVAREADWGICLARTDPEAAQHRGITYFLVDMTSPGLRIRPLKEITAESLFNEVFLDDVFVPDDRVVGPVNGGWRLARTTLAEERVAIGGGSALGAGVERLLRLATAEPGAEVDLDRLGALVAEGMSVSLIGLRSTVRRLRAEASSAGRSGAEAGRGAADATSAVLKLVGVDHRQAVAEAAYELLGPSAVALDSVTEPIAHELLLSRCLSIAGGTTQILLTQAAERLLGLPRASVG